MFKAGQEVKYLGNYFTGIKDVVGYIEGDITGDGFYLVHYPSLPENFEVCCDCHLHDVWGRCDKKQYLYIHKSDLVAAETPTTVDVTMVQDSVSEMKFNVGDKVRYIGDTYYKLKHYTGIVTQPKTEFGNTVVYYPSLPSREFVGGCCLHNMLGEYDAEKYIYIDPNDLELVKQLAPEPDVKPEAKIVYLPKRPSGARLKRAHRERLYREVLIKNWDAINKETDVLCINELCNGATLWSVNDPYVALQEIEKDNPDLEFIVVNSAGEKIFHLSELSLRIKHKPKRWDIKK